MTTAIASDLHIVMGLNDNLYLGRGWHGLQEAGGGVKARWTTPRAEFRLDGISGAGSIGLLVSGEGAPGYGISLFRGDERIGHVADGLKGTGWRLLEFPVTHGSGDRFAIRTEQQLSPGSFRTRGFIPHSLLGNGDYREMGCLVAAIRFR